MKPGKPLSEAHDIFGQRPHPLDPFFAPKNIAVLGATEAPGTVGRTTLWNLMSSPFGGAVFPVNPKRPSVLGIKAYASVKDIPAEVDLAVVVTNARLIPGLIDECGEAGCKAAVVISAGFKEAGEEGQELERQLLANARKHGMRIIGPNCLGVMIPPTGVNATFAAGMAKTGNVGFLSQSGALCTAVLDWSLREMVGFSAFMSLGSMADVGWGDLIYYLGNDPKTRSILIYMESVGDARSFLSAAREVAYSKPIIVIKAGRTAAGSKAAASHTGSLTGSDDVLDAAFRRSGVLRVTNIAELFYMAEVLAKQPRPRGPRLTILTNAGGPGVLAADSLLLGGGELAEISQETISELNQILPPTWSHGNPIDIIGDADPARYAKALEIAAKDQNSDGLLVILTPQAMTDATQTAQALKPYAKLGDKPVIASWMGGVDVAAGEQILNNAGIPTFPYPDTAARMFNYMWRYASNLRALYETPRYGAAGAEVRAAEAAAILSKARSAGRTILTEHESKQVLFAYGIPTVPSIVAETEDEAAAAAAKIGYPVVLKLHSYTITHKTDVGGVKLNLKNEADLRKAWQEMVESVSRLAGKEHFNGGNVQPFAKLEGYEVILGSTIDPQFGPVILFGMGGQLVEVFKDRALALPPLNTTLARRMMERTRIFKALKGVRGRASVDLHSLEQLLVAFSQLVVEQHVIKEIDINPLLASDKQLIALDARVVLHEPGVKDEDLPRPAIRPYPSQYEGPFMTRSGEEVLIRPIRPEDEPMMVRFHESLSDRTVYQRYLQILNLPQRTAHERLVRICFIDYARQMALVVERTAPDGEKQIIGVGRLQNLVGPGDAEFAIVISDDRQHDGLGTELLNRLIAIGRAEGVKAITADILAENMAMQRICEKAGFKLTREFGEPVVSARLDLV